MEGVVVDGRIAGHVMEAASAGAPAEGGGAGCSGGRSSWRRRQVGVGAVEWVQWVEVGSVPGAGGKSIAPAAVVGNDANHHRSGGGVGGGPRHDLRREESDAQQEPIAVAPRPSEREQKRVAVLRPPAHRGV